MELAVYLAKEVAAILRAVLTHETKKLYNDSTVASRMEFRYLAVKREPGSVRVPGSLTEDCCHRVS